jgi:hypothetical protein
MTNVKSDVDIIVDLYSLFLYGIHKWLVSAKNICIGIICSKHLIKTDSTLISL